MLAERRLTLQMSLRGPIKQSLILQAIFFRRRQEGRARIGLLREQEMGKRGSHSLTLALFHI